MPKQHIRERGMKPLPFPKSLPDFQRLFPNDAACGSYMEKLRWPEGFVPPARHGDAFNETRLPFRPMGWADVVADRVARGAEEPEPTLTEAQRALRERFDANPEALREVCVFICSMRLRMRQGYARCFLAWAYGASQVKPERSWFGLSAKSAREIELKLARFGVVNPETGSPF
jgi:hypothetical protein